MPTLITVTATLYFLLFQFCIVRRQGEPVHQVTLVHWVILAVSVVLDTDILQRQDIEIEWIQPGNSPDPKVQDTANTVWSFSYPFYTWLDRLSG